MITSEHIVMIVGALVAVLLQLFVAPHIMLFSVVPNFIVAYAVVMVVIRPRGVGDVLPFVLGIIFDFIGGAPLGAMAFVLTLTVHFLAALFVNATNDTPFMALAFIVLGVLVVEVLYGIILLMFGYPASLPDAVAMRIAPCFAYDTVISLIMFPILSRFAQPAVASRTDITQLR